MKEKTHSIPFVSGAKPETGEGIQYGAPAEIERQQLKMQVQGLKHDRMVNYAEVVEKESEAFIENWDDSGEFDIYDAFTKLTLKTSTHCLLGADFRYQLTEEFADLYHDLEDGLAPSSISDPFQDDERFRRRDAARERLALQGLRGGGGKECDGLPTHQPQTARVLSRPGYVQSRARRRGPYVRRNTLRRRQAQVYRQWLRHPAGEGHTVDVAAPV